MRVPVIQSFERQRSTEVHLSGSLDPKNKQKIKIEIFCVFGMSQRLMSSYKCN